MQRKKKFGNTSRLLEISLPLDRETGKKRGFAFVEFSDAQQAQEAIRQFNNQPFKGRPLAVNEARAREAGPRPAGGGGMRPAFTPRPPGPPMRSPAPDFSEPAPSDRDRPARKN